MVKIEHLSKIFPPRGKGGEPFTALHDINLNIREKEFFTIIGPSGCGKSTLVRLIAGLEKATSGRIFVNDKELLKSSSDVIVVWQDFALMDWRTVIQNIEFGLEISAVHPEKRKVMAEKYMKLVGLAGFANRYPYELSGGMKQRVGLARALVLEPRVLVMDEPLGSLDAQTRVFLQDELLRIWDESKRTVIFVTHGLDEAIYLSDRIAIFSAAPGKIIETYEVDLPRPRTHAMRSSRQFLELYEKLYNLLKPESRH